MKKLLLTLTLILPFLGLAQIVKIVPTNANLDQEIEIIYDASQGTAGLKGATSVYMHSGVIIDTPEGTNWTSVQGNWGKDDGLGKMTKVDGKVDIWSIKIKSIRSYYGLSANAVAFRLSMVFRNADGTKEGKGTPGAFEGGSVAANQDIFLNLKIDNYLLWKQPVGNTILLKPGETLNISASGTPKPDTLKIALFGGAAFTYSKSQAGLDVISGDVPVGQSGEYKIEATGVWKGEVKKIEKLINVLILKPIIAKSLPAGIKKGINYEQNTSKVTLVLEAPKKQIVYAVGDFNNWIIDDKYRLTPTPDGKYFWITIDNLISGKDYVFQYWVDGDIKIADPYAEQVADPYNDKFIVADLFPNLPIYTKTDYGIASVLKTGQQAFSWQESEKTFKRTPKDQLIIYKLLIRDFVGKHSYKAVMDSLDYLKKMGVNALELMPIMEFEGNESWGYNPSFFFAPDKYYGTKDDLKRLIQAAHKQGITVILDMVLNHAFGQNSNVRLYWDQAKNKPAADNPWFNPDATHPYNVGYDFNHESAFTQAFVDSVNTYWLKEYHFDGFRFDLSKGFTQTSNTDVGKWSARDESRIKLLKRMNNQIKKVDANAIVILEHFAEFSEETELHKEGMLTWGNGTYGYGNLLVGNNDNIVGEAINNNQVFYMESHDEERLMVKGRNTNNKTATLSYSDSLVVLNKIKQLAAFFYTMPGSKMMWQFQELGYNKSIDFNGRVGNKPLPWGVGGLGLYEDAERKKLLGAHAAIMNLVNNNRATFDLKNMKSDLGGEIKSYSFDGPELDVVCIGNFSKRKENLATTFLANGKWYDYFSGDSITVSDLKQSFLIYPGNFRLFTNKKLAAEKGVVSDLNPIIEIDRETPTSSDDITILFHAKLAIDTKTDKIAKESVIYMVTAPITEGPNSTKTGTILGEKENTYLLQKLPNTDDWTVKINPKTAFTLVGSDNIYRMAVYFRNVNGTAEGKGYDKSWMYINFKSTEKIVSINPEAFDQNTPITVTFDAAAADPGSTQGLVGVSSVYMHSGIISDSPTGTGWKYVVGNWGKDDGLGKMTKVAGTANKWEIKITPKSYYKDVPATDKWYRIGMVFRNENGTREGKGAGAQDIFVNFTPNTTAIVTATEPSLELIPIIYPNPSMDSFMIKSIEVIESIDVFSANGSYIYNLNPKVNNYKLQAGNYIIKIKTKSGIFGLKFISL